MKYDLKTLSIILIVAPIRYVHMRMSGGDPVQFIYPLLTIGASLVLAGVMKVSVLHQFVIAISTILPNLIVSLAMMGGYGDGSRFWFELFPVLFQVILQSVTAILILNGLNPFIVLIITTSILPVLMFIEGVLELLYEYNIKKNKFIKKNN